MTTTSGQDELRSQILEAIDYHRFEQEWANLQIIEKHGSKEHRDNCGVYQKMDKLNSDFADWMLERIAHHPSPAPTNDNLMKGEGE